MAYGANRSSVATDTFDASISASWTNGEADFDPLAFVAGGHVGSAAGWTAPCHIRRNTGTYTNDHYSTATVQALNAADFNAVEVTARRQASASDESCYLGHVNSTDAGEGAQRYEILELDSSFNFTLLTGSGTPGALSANDTITIEVEGTAIRFGTSESGGADTQRISTTDNTIASGWPGMGVYASSNSARAQLTAWEGGTIAAAGGGGGVARLAWRMTMLGVN